MTQGLVPGCVLHWSEFRFADGASADKFIVLLGAKSGCNYLVVLATSRPHRRKFSAGCHAEDGYYFIPGGGRDHFPKDTWLLLAEPYEFSPGDFLKAHLTDKKLRVYPLDTRIVI